jgi:hypothetical protein
MYSAKFSKNESGQFSALKNDSIRILSLKNDSSQISSMKYFHFLML